MTLNKQSEWDIYFKNYNYEPQCFYLENVNDVSNIEIKINGLDDEYKKIKRDDKCIMIIDTFNQN